MPALSLVIPVFNEEAHLEASLERVLSVLPGAVGTFELIVVCDGCSDRSAEIARSVDDRRVRVLELVGNRGKGAAIAYGLSYATGQTLGWFDADLDIHPEVLTEAFSAVVVDEFDCAIGSKRHRASIVVYPLSRRLLSLIYQAMLTLLFRIKIRDSQVGAKVFRRDVFEEIGDLLLVKRYAFDIEFLAVANAFGFRNITEVPVTIDLQFHLSSIQLGDIFRMLIDTLAVWYRLNIRRYYQKIRAARNAA